MPQDWLTQGELDRAGIDLLALQRGLTGERSLIGFSYMEEVRRLSAYLLFYWFTSYVQTWGMLDMAFTAYRAQGLKPISPKGQPGGASPRGDAPKKAVSCVRILDLGSGPGPCAFAAADWFRTREPAPETIEITACDQSLLALEAAERLAKSAGYRFTKIGPWRAGTDTLPEGSYRCILIGHLLNELYQDDPDRIEKRAALVNDLGKHLEPGGSIVILEPALLGTGRDLLILRDRLMEGPWQVAAPCFTQGPCPAAAQKNLTCHSDFTWDPPRTVRELERRTGLDKDVVKTTALVLYRPSDLQNSTKESQTTERPVSDKLYRLVSEPMLNKAGRTRLILCGKRGRIPLSVKLGAGYPAEHLFKKLRRSDAIVLHAPEQRETGLALGPATEITRL